MKLPSLKKLIQQTGVAIKRFPLVSLFAIIGTCIAIYLIDANLLNEPEKELFKIIQTLSLGALLNLAIVLNFEAKNNKRWRLYLTQIIALILLIAYYYSIPEFELVRNFAIYAALFTGLVFTVLCAPFIRTGLSLGFWHFVKTLFLRVFFAAIFLGVLFGGVALALASIGFLFGVDVPGERYGQIYIFVVGILGVHFVLAGIPEKTALLEKITEYPKGLKLFAQYIVIPLVTLYFIILYSYSAKVLITGNWPEGFLAYMIIWFAIAGIAASLLLFPLQKHTEHPWVKWFSRVFYIAVLPMTGMLFWAIQIRISEYGITEKRYYVIVLGCWLIGISLYFIFSKKQNIVLIASSLAIIALLSAFGPWSATNISEANQVNRLADILEQNGMLQNNLLTDADVALPTDDANEVEEILYYLQMTHGFSALYDWSDQLNDNMGADTLGDLLGVDFTTSSYYIDRESEGAHYRAFMTVNENPIFSISGYDYGTELYLDTYDYDRVNENQTYIIGGQTYTIHINQMRNGIELRLSDNNIRSINLQTFLESLQEKYTDDDEQFFEVPQDDLLLETEDEYGKMKLYIENIDFQASGAGITISDLNCILLMQKPPIK